jgi:cyclopropane fatty-acyl-phospholipid synthase-like methyltransferase
MHEYDQIHDWFGETRGQTIGVAEVGNFLAPLPAGSAVLDAGCGTGLPIAGLMIERGLKVCAIDSSARMIASFRKNFPDVKTECARLQESNMFDRSFNAIVAWGVLFHLSADDQAIVLGKFARALSPGARLLFTSGKEDGERDGEMRGVHFHYVSLGSRRYTAILHGNGMQMISEFFGEGENYYYVAEKRP